MEAISCQEGRKDFSDIRKICRDVEVFLCTPNPSTFCCCILSEGKLGLNLHLLSVGFTQSDWFNVTVV